MSDDSLSESIARSQREEDAKRAGMEFATEFYTGEKCRNCGRYRVGLRKNGREICEKCDADQADYP